MIFGETGQVPPRVFRSEGGGRNDRCAVETKNPVFFVPTKIAIVIGTLLHDSDARERFVTSQ